MTIRKGEEWGAPVGRQDGLRSASSDAELAQMLRSDRRSPITVTGGDVWRSVGSPPSRQAMQRLPFDLMHVTVDDERVLAVAHVVARRSWWRGPIVGVFNVSGLGDWNVVGRAHPNDGRLDIVEVDASMPLRARWNARSRLPTGTHVPHPCIVQRRATDAEWRFDRHMWVTVDGGEPRRATTLRVTVEADAFALDI